MGSGVQVVWFKRDLRSVDHRPLVEAAQRGPLLPLYIVEPAYWRLPDSAARHWAFVAECLGELRQSLADIGQPLVIRTGEADEVLEALRRALAFEAIWSHEETGNAWTYARDKQVAAWAREAGVVWHELPAGGVVRRLKTRNGWAKRWDRRMHETVLAQPDALPPLAGLDVGGLPRTSELFSGGELCPQRQTGGRKAGKALLQSFLDHRGQHYRSRMSSPLGGFEACSRLSPHLAWGSLSVREVAQATWRRQLEARGAWRGSLKSFEGRLHWRDHFIQKLEDAPEIEWRNLHPAHDGLRPSESASARMIAWSAGETGLPFVDAVMRCLSATGWMNFRMRAMLAAVASYHLWLDWRAPGEHLARLFTDYEPGIHWSQMQMQSGTTGINTIRIYNPVKQGHDQDPEGRFVRRWVPELAAVPDRHLQEPWKWEGAAGILGRRYPFPIVDHLAAARHARQKLWSLRGSQAFRKTAEAIQEKHGSRKSGIKNRGSARKRRAGGNQLDLPLAGGGAGEPEAVEE